MESRSLEGERPVTENRSHAREFLSSASHVKRRVNPRGPPRKAEYHPETDSERVPRGKGEKNRCERSEIEPETVCLQGVGASKWSDGVPFA